VFGRLRVLDDGVGLPDPGVGGSAAGFGSRLVSLLGSQIDAEVRSLDGPGTGTGTGTEIVFPIP
jgi:two-component sensor histidine kinase